MNQNQIYKTVRIVQDNGRGAEINFGCRVKQFKCRNGCEHHNHLVCVVCGQERYLDSALLENLQDNLAKSNGFTPRKHDFQIYGVCENCS